MRIDIYDRILVSYLEVAVGPDYPGPMFYTCNSGYSSDRKTFIKYNDIWYEITLSQPSIIINLLVRHNDPKDIKCIISEFIKYKKLKDLDDD